MKTRSEVDCCPLCRGEYGTFAVWQDADERLIYQRCMQCGLVFQAPRVSDEFLQTFYTQGYRTVVQGTEAITMKDLRIQAGRARFQAAFCEGVLKDVQRHLDIGSSSGMLLRAIQKRTGGVGVGVEPGQVYREACREEELDIYPSLEVLADADQTPFDLISMSHVLEHIADPYEYLCQLREKWLAPGGYLLIEVPNLYGHHSFELSHLLAFSPGTLRLLLRAAGFHVMRIQAHGVPRSPILRLYITVLARADGHVLPRESLRRTSSFAGLRRRAGMKLYDVLTARLPSWTWQELPQLDEELEEGTR